jgi:hypothetical protein
MDTTPLVSRTTPFRFTERGEPSATLKDEVDETESILDWERDV